MKIVWSAWALERAEGINGQLLEKAGDKIANRIFDEIQQGISLLKEYPVAGQMEPWLENKGLEHRRLVIGNHKVIYRIVGKEIRITDLFDTRQDPRTMKT